MGRSTVAKARQRATVGTLKCLKSCQMWGFTTSIQLRFRCCALFGGVSTPRMKRLVVLGKYRCSLVNKRTVVHF